MVFSATRSESRVLFSHSLDLFRLKRGATLRQTKPRRASQPRTRAAARLNPLPRVQTPAGRWRANTGACFLFWVSCLRAPPAPHRAERASTLCSKQRVQSTLRAWGTWREPKRGAALQLAGAARKLFFACARAFGPREALPARPLRPSPRIARSERRFGGA